MRKTKKMACALLAVVMVFAMSVTAFAVDNYTITINNSTDGYEYTAYQIFSGTLYEEYEEYTGTSAPTGGTQLYTYNTVTDTYEEAVYDAASGSKYYYISKTVLSNIVWGSGINSTDQALLTALRNEYGTTVAAEIAEKLENAEDAEAFAAIVGDYLTTGANSDDTSPYSISVNAAGYYLIKNTKVPSGYYAYTDFIMEVVEDVTTTPKEHTPTSTKTVADINDSTDTSATANQTSADYDIDDNVSFTLTATLPENYASYDSYKLIFHDEMDNGLTFNEDAVVKVGDTVVDSDCYTVVYPNNGTGADDCTFEVIIDDTHDLIDENNDPIILSAGSVITVSYSAALNSGAVTGSTGNKNTSYIEYSNDPNYKGVVSDSPTGTTPEETVVVYTYSLTVNKVKEDGTTPLPGAGFTLYKYDADDEDYVQVGNELGKDADENYTLTFFTWTGLDDGQYKLVETTTPDGYNTMEDVVFYIVAEHDTTGVTSLKVTSDAAGTTDLTDWTVSASDGTITTNIKNETGSPLPSTGGIGTTIFYIVGGVLVFGAVVLLITRRRMRKSQ